MNRTETYVTVLTTVRHQSDVSITRVNITLHLRLGIHSFFPFSAPQ